ncbi:GIY-YIG nuclease family protein [Algibacter sp. AS12]|uniref:GIY-YIG nuclease family protein n=1 Tax=Algibacter sp. AS12 TaxID=3135773 RepID=UPI00398AF925
MIFYVYVISSEKDNLLFKGLTNDLQKKIAQHNMGEHKETKEHRPWVLVYSKVFTSRVKAKEYENYLKAEEGIEFLKNKLK